MSLRCAPSRWMASRALLAERPGATLLAGGTDVGLWVTKQLRDLPTLIYIGNVAELDRIDADAGRDRDRRRRDAHRRFRGAPRGVSGPARDRAPLRLAADLQRRHALRQRRQRLADRRFDARPDRARRHRRAAQRARRRARCRSRSSTSATRTRRWRRASSSRRCASRARARRARCAPTRSPSATTRTSRRCARPSRVDLADGHVRTRARLLRRHGRRCRSGPRAAKRRSLGARWTRRRSRKPSQRWLRTISRSATCARRGDTARTWRGNLLRRFSCRRVGRRRRRERLELRGMSERSEARGGVGGAARHESAHLHVSGEALYTDDIAAAARHAARGVGTSEQAHARIRGLDLAARARGARRRRRADGGRHPRREQPRARSCTTIRSSPRSWSSTPASRCSPSSRPRPRPRAGRRASPASTTRSCRPSSTSPTALAAAVPSSCRRAR